MKTAFQTMRTPPSAFLFCALSVAVFAADPAGIPEPPLVIYGTVTAGAANQPVTITSVTLPVTNTPETTGKLLCVDLTLPAVTTSETWAAAHFPNPAAPGAGRTADPDGDGQTNEQEYTAGNTGDAAIDFDF